MERIAHLQMIHYAQPTESARRRQKIKRVVQTKTVIPKFVRHSHLGGTNFYELSLLPPTATTALPLPLQIQLQRFLAHKKVDSASNGILAPLLALIELLPEWTPATLSTLLDAYEKLLPKSLAPPPPLPMSPLPYDLLEYDIHPSIVPIQVESAAKPLAKAVLDRRTAYIPPVTIGSLEINRNNPEFIERKERVRRARDYGNYLRTEFHPENVKIEKTKILADSAELGRQRRLRIAEYVQKLPKPLPPVKIKKIHKTKSETNLEVLSARYLNDLKKFEKLINK